MVKLNTGLKLAALLQLAQTETNKFIAMANTRVPLFNTMPWESRFHIVWKPGGKQVPNTLSKLRFSPATTIRWRIGERVGNR
jgi:hypothetical protein